MTHQQKTLVCSDNGISVSHGVIYTGSCGLTPPHFPPATRAYKWPYGLQLPLILHLPVQTGCLSAYWVYGRCLVHSNCLLDVKNNVSLSVYCALLLECHCTIYDTNGQWSHLMASGSGVHPVGCFKEGILTESNRFVHFISAVVMWGRIATRCYWPDLQTLHSWRVQLAWCPQGHRCVFYNHTLAVKKKATERWKVCWVSALSSTFLWCNLKMAASFLILSFWMQFRSLLSLTPGVEGAAGMVRRCWWKR